MATLSPMQHAEADYRELCEALEGQDRIWIVDAARLLKCHPTYLLRKVHSGKLEASEMRVGKLARRCMLLVDSFKAFAKARMEEAAREIDSDLDLAEAALRKVGDNELADAARAARGVAQPAVAMDGRDLQCL